jgi:hypothetical protein
VRYSIQRQAGAIRSGKTVLRSSIGRAFGC